MQNFNNGTSFVGITKDGKYYDTFGNLIGYSIEEYNKALNMAKDYEKILYDKGILVRPKTAEEINQELQKTLQDTQNMMKEMSKSLLALSDKVNGMEKDDEHKQKSSNGAGREILKLKQAPSSK
jgi:hypothetical protein